MFHFLHTVGVKHLDLVHDVLIHDAVHIGEGDAVPRREGGQLAEMEMCIRDRYSAYALWDNSQVYAAADNVQAELLQFKPKAGADNGASFEELLGINPDVCAWVTLDNTAIDYPVVQGEDNFTYVNTDVYGDFSLAGSIFLDVNCDKNFTDPYSLLYGHHMEESKMFGDLDLRCV